MIIHHRARFLYNRESDDVMVRKFIRDIRVMVPLVIFAAALLMSPNFAAAQSQPFFGRADTPETVFDPSTAGERAESMNRPQIGQIEDAFSSGAGEVKYKYDVKRRRDFFQNIEMPKRTFSRIR